MKEHIDEIERPTLRMSAYYYSFDATGVREVDLILSAVACAGKAAHHTEDWRDECRPFHGHTGKNPVEWIENAAKSVAISHASLVEQRDRLLKALDEYLVARKEWEIDRHPEEYGPKFARLQLANRALLNARKAMP